MYVFQKEYRTEILSNGIPGPAAVAVYRVSSKDVDTNFPEKGLHKPSYFRFERVGSKGDIFLYGSFVFAPVEGCCGIVVSAKTYLEPKYRGTGASDIFRDIKESTAKELGYSLMLATTQMKDVPAVGNMIKSKYNIIDTFTNKRTDNLLGIGIKKI